MSAWWDHEIIDRPVLSYYYPKKKRGKLGVFLDTVGEDWTLAKNYDVIVDPRGGYMIIVIGIFIIVSLTIISVVYIMNKYGVVRDYDDEKRVSAPLVHQYSPYVVERRGEAKIYYCDRCGEKIDFPANFCHGCGNITLYQMKIRYCRDCGTKIVTDAKYCVQCGRSV